MSKLEEFLHNSILEEMCNNRFDEFESAYIRSVRDRKELFTGVDYEQELIDLISENVQDKKKKAIIKHKLTELEISICNDLSESIKRAYKLGFIDALKLKDEVRALIENDKKYNSK